ncbi:GNAT family N-acetyltransferase [Lentibacillus sp. N15]|uniref:GNAT family N-acetyltransferase n=1 Tax=Lentibacillus songyuanensis TaxID=3136161 RepID=UPI0031B9E85D
MTQDIQLRALEKDDLSFLHKLLNNPDIMNFWFSESYMSLESLKESFDKNKDNEQSREFILINQDHDRLGFVGLYEIEQRHRNAEFAVMIDPAYQGKGYATIATQLAMDYAFAVLNLHKLYLIVAKENEKASHIYKKAGFQTEGEMSEHFYINGEYHDGVMMRIFDNDYWKMASQKNN